MISIKRKKKKSKTWVWSKRRETKRVGMDQKRALLFMFPQQSHLTSGFPDIGSVSPQSLQNCMAIFVCQT